MGLFDQILGSVMGGSSSGGAAPGGMATGGSTAGEATGAAALLETIINHEGGLNGLVQKFNDAGLGNVVGSWIGNGQNAQVSPDALHQVLGSDFMQQIAARTGLPMEQVGNLAAQYLPQLVDGMTPNGQVQANHPNDLLSLGASFLKGRFGIG